MEPISRAAAIIFPHSLPDSAASATFVHHRLLLSLRRHGTDYAEMASELEVDALAVSIGWALVTVFTSLSSESCSTVLPGLNFTNLTKDSQDDSGPCVPPNASDAAFNMSAGDGPPGFDFEEYVVDVETALLMVVFMTFVAVRSRHRVLKRVRLLEDLIFNIRGGGSAATPSAPARYEKLARSDAGPMPAAHMLWVGSLQLMVAWSVFKTSDTIFKIGYLNHVLPYGGAILYSVIITAGGYAGAQHFGRAKAANEKDLWPSLEACCAAIMRREGATSWPPPQLADWGERRSALPADGWCRAGACDDGVNGNATSETAAWDVRYVQAVSARHATKLLNGAPGGSALVLRQKGPFPVLAFVPPWVGADHDDSQWAAARVRTQRLGRCTDGLWTTSEIESRRFYLEMGAAVMGVLIAKSWERTLDEGIFEPAFEAWEEAEIEAGESHSPMALIGIENVVYAAVLACLKLAYAVAHDELGEGACCWACRKCKSCFRGRGREREPLANSGVLPSDARQPSVGSEGSRTSFTGIEGGGEGAPSV